MPFRLLSRNFINSLESLEVDVQKIYRHDNPQWYDIHAEIITDLPNFSKIFAG
jgi:hypothetical protein